MQKARRLNMQRPISNEEMEELKKHLDLGSPENEAAAAEESMPLEPKNNVDPSAFQMFLEEEVKELLLNFPDCGIEGANDLGDLENPNEVLQLWSKGIPLYRAYAAVNFEKILEKSAGAVRQAVLNSFNSKKRFKRTKESSNETDFVPPEVYREYREFFPGWSESKIKADYRKRI